MEQFERTDNRIVVRHKKIRNRAYMVDFRGIRSKEEILDDTPKAPMLGRRILSLRKFKSVQELKDKISAYFFGADKRLEPYTMSGLARALGVTTSTLQEYARGYRDGYNLSLEEETFSDIIDEARQRIEEFAEKNLYSKYGFNGAKFMLDVSFGWLSGRDAWAIKEIDSNIRIKTKELEMKQKLLEDDEGDSNITINVVRKDK